MPTGAFLIYFGLPIFLQSTLLWLLLRRNAVHDNPWFVSYTVFSIAATILRLIVFRDAAIYFYLYWAGQAVYAILSLLVLYGLTNTSNVWRITRQFSQSGQIPN